MQVPGSEEGYDGREGALMALETARATALKNRQNAALDKRYRDGTTGEIFTYRAKLDAGTEYAYRRAETDLSTGRTEYGLVYADDARAEIERIDNYTGLYARFGAPDAVALEHARYSVVPKLIADYAEALPLVRITHNAGRRVSTELAA